MTRTFQIRDGITIRLMTPEGAPREYRSGPGLVTDDQLGPKLKGYLEAGHLLEPDQPARPVELQVLTNDSVRDRKKGDLQPLTKAEEMGMKPPKGGTRLISKGKFDVDPRTLVGKSLEDLNLLIGEIDPKEPRGKTLADALRTLTQDHRSPVRASDVDVSEAEDGTVGESVPRGAVFSVGETGAL